MKEKKEIVIADDHPLFLYGVKQLVEDSGKFEITGEFNSGENVFQFIENNKPNFAILDIRMPGCSGLEIVEKISNSGLPTKVILLTMYKNLNYFYKSVSFGVKGYILKDSAAKELIEALTEISNGGVFISRDLQNQFDNRKIDSYKQKMTMLSINSLTAAERNILKLIAEWKSTKEIAEQLFISERTVSNHRNHICEKLNLKGANRLVRFAIENKELF